MRSGPEEGHRLNGVSPSPPPWLCLPWAGQQHGSTIGMACWKSSGDNRSFSACNLDQLNFRSLFRVKEIVGEQRPKNPKYSGRQNLAPKNLPNEKRENNAKTIIVKWKNLIWFVLSFRQTLDVPMSKLKWTWFVTLGNNTRLILNLGNNTRLRSLWPVSNVRLVWSAQKWKDFLMLSPIEIFHDWPSKSSTHRDFIWYAILLISLNIYQIY